MSETGKHEVRRLPTSQDGVPIGIVRIREEWLSIGVEGETGQAVTESEPELDAVVFEESDGGAGVGDYTLDQENVRQMLALSQEAIDRLVIAAELDSVLVRAPNGSIRRIFSETSIRRFLEDSAIDPDAISSAAKALANNDLEKAVAEVQEQVAELRLNQTKILQQMKDILLLEVRNLKEQDRDLASFVYELAEEIRARMGKRR